MSTNPSIAFFGTPDLAVPVLNGLKARDFVPSLIITQPDKPKGRKLILTPPPVKVWADEHSIETLQPTKLDDAFMEAIQGRTFDLFIVAAYGLIIPQRVLDLPQCGTLNVHPSLLPKYRGASPVQGQILADDRACGITIMEMDAGMDHGPIVAQAEVTTETWPLKATDLHALLWPKGAELLADCIPPYCEGSLVPIPQAHEEATFTTKFKKEDGKLDLAHDDPYQMYLKYCAFDSWPGVYFFEEIDGKQVRVKITDAEFAEDTFRINRVIPEGKSEQKYTS